MNIFCAGINHRTAPVEIRERFAVLPHEMGSVLQEIRGFDSLHEAVVLSTCNRVEFYTTSICPERARTDLEKWMERRAGFRPPIYWHDTARSVRHLFRVSCGLDSMVLGETEVLGQIKQAYSHATEAGTTSRHLNKLFQHAFRVAKNVRTHTQITRGATSVGSVAVELATKIFGHLQGRRVMILGAGETSERTARSLQSRGIQSVIVSNRTFDRAARLAEEIGGMAIHFDHWHKAFHEVDILISSTAAPHPILTKEKLAPMMRDRADRPLFVIDLAVPRDAEPAINELEGVFLYDIDSLKEIAGNSRQVRQQEIQRCEQLIDHNVQDFVGWMRRLHHGEFSIGDFRFSNEDAGSRPSKIENRKSRLP
ncbi:MAG TPA: glutamyl-tRNA reductase [Chthoniobacterales bacterium]